ncbi:MAG: hypothetical protein P8I58_04815 [Flavobacteriaceae bacterium]|jgi:hypothetical protein|nr:hypothetical protein [Flavobacteriaceae bacterium]
MKSIGIMIRRRSRTNKKLLDKQILTLHKKLKKNDNIITHYSTEKDYLKGNYHSHLLIQYNNDKNLYNELNRFIGGNVWNKDYEGLDEVKINNGKWGEIHTHNIWDEVGFKGYINKNELTKILY